MIPFIVFVTATGVSVVVHWLVHLRSHRPLNVRDTTQRSLAYGLAAMLVVAASGHFVEPLRSGLVAIVPPLIPFPDLVITATGLFELVIAAVIVVPATRKLMAWVLVAYLIAVFPANVLAATSVEHPDAPSTPLLLRGLIQIVFIASAVIIARTAEGITVRALIDRFRRRGSARLARAQARHGERLATDVEPAQPQETTIAAPDAETSTLKRCGPSLA